MQKRSRLRVLVAIIALATCRAAAALAPQVKVDTGTVAGSVEDGVEAGRKCWWNDDRLMFVRSARCHRRLPEADGVENPSFGARPDAKAEAMTHVGIHPELHARAGVTQGVDAAYHRPRRSDSIILAHDDERGRFIGGVVGMRGVRHHDG